MANNSLDGLFDVSEISAIGSVGSAICDTSSSNRWYDNTSFSIGDNYTQGQREIFHKFGGAYGLNGNETGLMMRIAVHGFLNDKFMRGPYGGGLTTYLSRSELYSDNDLTSKGRAVVDMLVDSVSGKITQHEANAIMHCIGFNTTPTQEGHINPVRDSFERYLTGKKGYTPGRDQIIIMERRLDGDVDIDIELDTV